MKLWLGNPSPRDEDPSVSIVWVPEEEKKECVVEKREHSFGCVNSIAYLNTDELDLEAGFSRSWCCSCSNLLDASQIPR